VIIVHKCEPLPENSNIPRSSDLAGVRVTYAAGNSKPREKYITLAELKNENLTSQSDVKKYLKRSLKTQVEITRVMTLKGSYAGLSFEEFCLTAHGNQTIAEFLDIDLEKFKQFDSHEHEEDGDSDDDEERIVSVGAPRSNKSESGTFSYIMLASVLILVVALFYLKFSSETWSYTYEELTASYEILGIPFDATKQEVAKVWKQKNLEFHPDKCKGPDCQEMHQTLTAAHELVC
jgi:hypothetical protein